MAAFTYMGTKKSLAGQIAALCDGFPDGSFFDLFSGISAAGASVAPARQIWCNDTQFFSRTLTEALYLSVEEGPRVNNVKQVICELGNQNLNLLARLTRTEIEAELTTLWSGNVERQVSLQAGQIEETGHRRKAWEGVYSHCLFTALYAGSYLGLVQALQVDAIRYGADEAKRRELISGEEHRWALLALCRAVAATSNSTGHFAQYLTASASNVRRVMDKRRRCVWSFWSNALAEMKPIGTVKWRASNRVYHGDAIQVLDDMRADSTRPTIVYADPPYTNDQYSRFYHLLETVLLYDYPKTDGKGLYRGARFRSSFSLARQVERSFELMIASAGRVGLNLMVSYPSNGLLPNSLERIPDLMAEHFKEVDKPIIIPHKHSTLGGSKGTQKEDVEECIFIGRRARALH